MSPFMMSNTPSSGFGPPGVLDDRVVMFNYDPEGADDDLYWYDTDDRNCRGRIFRENIIVVIPADDAEDGYYILSMVCGDERPEYHKESDFAYKIRKQYAAGLPLPFLQRYPMYSLPKHLFCLWTRKNSSKFHIIVSQVGSPRAKEFLKAIVQPTLDAIQVPGDSYTLYEITPEQPLGELIAHTIRPLAQNGISQTILSVAGDQTLAELVNALATEQDRSSTYVAPVIGILALGQMNTFAYSLERNTSSTSLGLNTFLKGTPEPLPLIRVSLSDGWSWQVDGRQGIGKVTKTLYAFSSVSLGPSSCVSQCDTNKSGTQPDAYTIPYAYRNKLIIQKSAREDEVIGGNQHCYASAEIPADNTTSPTMLSFSYSALRPGANFEEFSISEHQNGEHLDADSSRREEIESLRLEFHGTKDSDPDRSISIDGRIIQCSIEAGWLEIERVPLGGGNLHVVTHKGVYECPAMQEIESEL
ncbi:hypothetical protein V8E51_019064 [Hyaloscypha variabilis]